MAGTQEAPPLPGGPDAPELYAAVLSQDLVTLRRLSRKWTLPMGAWIHALRLAESHAGPTGIIVERIQQARFLRPVDPSPPIQKLTQALEDAPLEPRAAQVRDTQAGAAIGQLLLALSPAMGVLSPAVFQAKADQLATQLSEALKRPPPS